VDKYHGRTALGRQAPLVAGWKDDLFRIRTGRLIQCLGIRFDPSTGKTFGQPFQVSKFDSARLRISGWIPSVGLSLTQDKLVLTMSQEFGNIWILDNVVLDLIEQVAHHSA
jgi:hypothetical protein